MAAWQQACADEREQASSRGLRRLWGAAAQIPNGMTGVVSGALVLSLVLEARRRRLGTAHSVVPE